MSAIHDEIVTSHRGATSEIRRLSSLIEISQALSGTLNLTAALPQALDVLERHHQVVRSAVTILEEDTRELVIRASTGLTADGQRARYRLGEGITGRVVDTGKSVVVPQVSKEPLLLNRAARRDRQELTFICVPLVINRRPVGALGVDLPFKKDRDFDRSLKFYKLVAAIIAQAVKVSRMAEAERKRLVDENTHLRDELARPLRLPAPGRHQCPDPAGLRPGGTGRAHQHDGVDPGRIGHRQGDDRPRHPLQLAAGEKAVHQGQLRGAARSR